MDDTDRTGGLRHPARLRLLFAVLAALLVLVPGGPAWAHNALVEASPAKKATLKKSPGEVRLRFLQKLDPDRTTITVSGPDQRQVPASEPSVQGSTGTVKLDETLPNGVYTVAYQVVSADGHTVRGSYEFTVGGPSVAATTPPASSAPAPVPSLGSAPAPAPSLDSAPAPAPSLQEKAVTAPEKSSGNGTIIGIAVAAVVVLAGLAGLRYARRRKA